MTKLNVRIRATGSACAAALLLAACGGGGSGDGGSSADSSLIIGGPSGQPASEATVEQIQATAANSAAQGLGANLGNIQQLSDDVLRNLNEQGTAMGIVGDTNTDALQTLDNDNNSFLNKTLGVNDPLATVQRSGDIVTIDPDEQRLCEEEFDTLSLGTEDAAQCQQLASDLLVEINAQTDETGVITYLFQNDPVMLIGYSPMGASYEIRLGGLQRVVEQAQQISGGTGDLAANFSGAVRLAAMVTNDQPGSEAGELTLQVTQALSLAPTDGSTSRFSLQPSTVFSIRADEATGDVSTSVNWGALQVIAEAGDSDGNTSLTAFNLGGLTADASLNANRPALSLNNVGIGGVPLTVSIDQVESLSLSLDTFGITFDDDSGMVTLDGALGAALTLNNMMGLVDTLGTEATVSFGIEAPAGTTLLEQFNGSTQVGAGGPLTLTAVGTDNSQSVQQTVTVNQGECFSSTDDDDEVIVPGGNTNTDTESESLGFDLEVVSCDP